VRGTLVNAAGDGPIANGVVSVHVAQDSMGTLGPLLATSRSGVDGKFTASFLRPGRYQVVAEDLARDAVSPAVGVEVKAGQTVDAGEVRF